MEGLVNSYWSQKIENHSQRKKMFLKFSVCVTTKNEKLSQNYLIDKKQFQSASEFDFLFCQFKIFIVYCNVWLVVVTTDDLKNQTNMKIQKGCKINSLAFSIEHTPAFTLFLNTCHTIWILIQNSIWLTQTVKIAKIVSFPINTSETSKASIEVLRLKMF